MELDRARFKFVVDNQALHRFQHHQFPVQAFIYQRVEHHSSLADYKRVC